MFLVTDYTIRTTVLTILLRNNRSHKKLKLMKCKTAVSFKNDDLRASLNKDYLKMSLVPEIFYRKPTVASKKVTAYLKVKKSKCN